jgi:hypothetical protein
MQNTAVDHTLRIRSLFESGRFTVFVMAFAFLPWAAMACIAQDDIDPSAENEGATEGATEIEDEWVDLIAGGEAGGWTRLGGRAEFAWNDGVIVGTARPGTPTSYLCTTDEYSDFELVAVCKIDAGLNSGIQLRSRVKKSGQVSEIVGLQVEIDSSQRFWTGGLYDEGRRGWLFTLENRPEARAAFRIDQWNTLRIVAQGPTIETWVNGVPAASINQAPDDSGFIALQVHSTDLTESLQVRFRELKIRPR